MEERTAVIANMCDGCLHRTPMSMFTVCELHPNTLELPCVDNNTPCPDYLGTIKGGPIKLIKVICACIVGRKDCPYCKGSGVQAVRMIGTPYPEE